MTLGLSAVERRGLEESKRRGPAEGMFDVKAESRRATNGVCPSAETMMKYEPGVLHGFWNVPG